MDEVSDGSASPDCQPDLSRADVVAHVGVRKVNVFLEGRNLKKI